MLQLSVESRVACYQRQLKYSENMEILSQWTAFTFVLGNFSNTFTLHCWNHGSRSVFLLFIIIAVPVFLEPYSLIRKSCPDMLDCCTARKLCITVPDTTISVLLLLQLWREKFCRMLDWLPRSSLAWFHCYALNMTRNIYWDTFEDEPSFRQLTARRPYASFFSNHPHIFCLRLEK